MIVSFCNRERRLNSPLFWLKTLENICVWQKIDWVSIIGQSQLLFDVRSIQSGSSFFLDKPILKIYVTVPIAQNPCNVHLYCEVSANPATEATQISWSVGTPATPVLVDSR